MYCLSGFGLSFEKMSNGGVRIVKREEEDVVMDLTIDEATWANILEDLRG